MVMLPIIIYDRSFVPLSGTQDDDFAGVMNSQKIEISPDIIFKIILILLGLWFLYLVREVIILLVISIILVSTMEPAVDWLQKKKVPRSVSVLGIYVILIAVLAASFSLLIPPLVSQFHDFTQNYPVYSQKVIDFFGSIKEFILANHLNIDTNSVFQEISGQVSNFTKNIFSTTVGFFSGVISIIVVFSLSFYMSVEEDGIKKFISSITPKKHRAYAVSLTERIKYKLGKWFAGQLALMLLIAVFDFVGLALAGVPYALILAIFAGIMEIIPYVGPIISAIPGVVLGFLVSPLTGFLALLVYIIAQQFENHVVLPQVMKRAVGLSPITVILVLLIGAKIAGTLGAILAVPVATAVSLVVKDYMEHREKNEV